MVTLSNANLIKAMDCMPEHLVTPEKKLTYGKVVNYILDEREARMNNNNENRSRLF